MIEFNTYPIFVADQVLTADHLNEIVNYLDEQDRLTRNKLIGIGIVCGLEITVNPEQIVLSKGCGVTSEGYLLVQDQATYTHFRPYELPEYFSPRYKPIYESWHLWELLNTEDSLEFDNAEFIRGNSEILSTKVVVLFLEMKERPLKNCIDIDCNDKGEAIEFNIKPLLVEKEDLDAFIRQNGEGESSSQTNLPLVALKRFNVPVSDLKNTNDVFNAFLEMVDESTLKQVSDALNFCYMYYHTILNEDNNPFSDLFNDFKNRLSYLKVANPLFIQYFYDWLDDLIKAYEEFRCNIAEVQSICCPDEGLFPLHLMLGEANQNTAIGAKYRQYFIFSPLFNEQKNRVPEVQLLFQRLKAMVSSYSIPNSETFFNTLIKITPSRHYDKPLSDRCIPYYYKPLETYPVWSWKKTKRGEAKHNLSYHAPQYSTADPVIAPLKYDIERYNFFRIEGHIGKPFSRALASVVNQRDQFNLPFEVVALSTATISEFFNAADHACQFNDLDAMYQVLLAELKCKLGDFECMAGRMPYLLAASRLTNTDTVREVVGEARLDDTIITGRLAANFSINDLRAEAYVRGDFMRTYCTVNKGSVAETYLNAVKNGVTFTRPSTVSRASNLFGVNAAATNTFLNLVYAYVFYFIETVENTFAVSLNEIMDDFDAELFTARYKAFSDFVKDLATIGEALERAEESDNNDTLAQLKTIGFYDFAIQIRALRHLCLDERFVALKAEYERRKRELQLLTNFLNYFKKHPGIEHKAGVPKGGTFILVYHETPPRRLIADFTRIRALSLNLPGALYKRVTEDQELSRINELIKTSYVQDPQLLKRFELALGKFVNTCTDMDEETKKRIRDILVRVPQEQEPLRFQVPEQAVVADFYLPYICCSDCPPITYVVPKTPDDVLSISIKPTSFCNRDASMYPVEVSPQGGILSATNGGVLAGKFEFSPLGINPGINTLTYTLPDGRSTSIDVQVAAGFDVRFTFEVMDNGLTVVFKPEPDQSNRTVLWDFGDGATSNEQAPVHTYQFAEDEQSFTVVLTVTDGPCRASAEREIILSRPREAIFDLVPKVFCINDAKEYDFNIHPFPDSLEAIKNEDRLILNQDADAKRIFFKPNRHRIGSTKAFHLEYNGMPLDVQVIVADASFFMNLRRADNDFILELRPKQEDATHYSWIISQVNNTFTFDERKLSISLNQLQIVPGRTFGIVLTVNYQLPSGDCRNEHRFEITRAIFDRHLDAGEFDDATTE